MYDDDSTEQHPVSDSSRVSREQHILVYDSEATGHHREYVQHIRTWWPTFDVSASVTLAVHPDIARDLPNEDASANSCSVLPLPKARVDRIYGAASLIQKSLEESRLMHEIALETGANHVVALTLNNILGGIIDPAVWRSPYLVSGILFFPYVRASIPNKRRRRIKASIKRFRKWLLLRLNLLGRRVQTVWILNDPEAAQALNRSVDSGRDRFASLSDPVPLGTHDSSLAPLRRYYDIGEDRTIFLFAGTLAARKGVHVVLDAFRTLDDKTSRSSALLLLGRPKDSQRSEIESAVARARENTELEICYDDRFASEAELGRAFRESDVVLLLYQRTEGSSGLLGHASRAGTPVLSATSGLIGNLVEAYELGERVEARSVDHVTRAIQRIVESGCVRASHTGMKTYVSERSPRQFASTLHPLTPPNHDVS